MEIVCCFCRRDKKYPDPKPEFDLTNPISRYTILYLSDFYSDTPHPNVHAPLHLSRSQNPTHRNHHRISKLRDRNQTHHADCPSQHPLRPLPRSPPYLLRSTILFVHCLDLPRTSSAASSSSTASISRISRSPTATFFLGSSVGALRFPVSASAWEIVTIWRAPLPRQRYVLVMYKQLPRPC